MAWSMYEIIHENEKYIFLKGNERVSPLYLMEKIVT